MEFASGNYGMIEAAYDYALDTTPPQTSIEYSAAKTAGEPVNFRFNWDGEAAVIRYTTDGSTPTLASPTYNAQMPRGLGEVLQIAKLGVTDVKWFATDIKGNQSAVQTQRFLIAADQKDGSVGGTVPATLSLTLGAPATFGAFTPGVAREYTASTTATVISTAGDATLTVADNGANPGRLVNGDVRVAAAAAGPRRAQDVARTDVERVRPGHVQAGHRRHRRPAHRRLLEDAHVHPEHHHAVTLRPDGT